MATYVKGSLVTNATSYELLEKKNGTYTSLATASEINFNVSDLGLANGDHTLVVKAKASGYADSDYSNEVIYTATGEEDSPEAYTDITSLFDFTMYPKTVCNVTTTGTDPRAQSSSFFDSAVADISAYAGKTIKIMIPKYTSGTGTQSMNATYLTSSSTVVAGETPGVFTEMLKLWEVSDTGVAKSGALAEYTLILPSDAKYLWTSIFNTTATSQGIGNTGFYCKVAN